VWVFRWLFKLFFLLNNLPHSGHLKFLIWLCLIKWSWRSLLVLNDFSHSGHLKFFAVWWTRRWWLFKFDIVLKAIPQALHSNSLLSSCDRKWLFKFFFLLKLLLQIVHLKSKRSLWTNEWSFNSLFDLNHFLQTKHSKGFLSLWVFRWIRRANFVSDFIPQISHSNCLFASECCRVIWLRKFVRNLKDFPQKLHLWVTNLACLWTCCRMFDFPWNTLPQTSHSNDLWAATLLMIGCWNLKVKTC
jgi:hypothetical protein